MKPFPRTLFVASALAILAENAAAAILLGNLPPLNDNAGTQISVSGPANQKAVSFTMPSLAYDVSSVDLRLSGYTTPPPGNGIDVASVGFYTDASGVPGALVGSLLTGPSSSSGVVANFSFTGSVNLAANSTYWLLVDASAGNFFWQASDTSATPSGAATFVGYNLSTDNGATYNPSAVLGSFQINAAPVPEPRQISAVVALALVGFGVWRRFAMRRANLSSTSSEDA